MKRPIQPFGKSAIGQRATGNTAFETGDRLFRWPFFVWVFVVGALAHGCGGLDQALPDTWRLSKPAIERLQGVEDPKVAEEEIVRALEVLFGTAQHPRWPMGQATLEGSQVLATHARFYRNECSHCHGLEGFGNGPSAQFLVPRPWNFSFGIFPRSAPDGGVPSVSSLAVVFRDGIDGTPMPPFKRLGDPALKGIAGHVLLLLQRSLVEVALVDAYLKDGSESWTDEGIRTLYETVSDDFGTRFQQANKPPLQAPDSSDSGEAPSSPNTGQK